MTDYIIPNTNPLFKIISIPNYYLHNILFSEETLKFELVIYFITTTYLYRNNN